MLAPLACLPCLLELDRAADGRGNCRVNEAVKHAAVAAYQLFRAILSSEVEQQHRYDPRVELVERTAPTGERDVHRPATMQPA
jgi:hypothetical protein